MKLKLQVIRRLRSSHIGHELYRSPSGGFYNVWFGSPNVHRWWALSICLYFRP